MTVREIKFRAWDKVYKHFHEGDLLNDYVIGEFIRNPEYEVSQYTGLKDKNGVEIYEGDIVHKTYKNSLTATGEVVYESATYFIREAEGHAFLYSGYDGEETEVIGNVYQNTELIEVNK